MNVEKITQAFATDGYVVIHDLVDTKLLEQITNELERVVEETVASTTPQQLLFDDETESRIGTSSASVRCMFQIQEHSSFLRDLLHTGRFVDLAETLLDDVPVAMGIQLIDKPPFASYEFPYHQDNAYMFVDPPCALVATVALDSQTADSGPISFLRGSQVLDILPHQPSGVIGASQGLVDPPDTETFPEVALELEAGDVLVHHTNVIHRTGPNRTGKHRRNLGFIYHGTGVTKDVEKLARYQRELSESN